MGSNQDFANASQIELSKCECESNRVGHCVSESNQKTANCESICELRLKMGHFMKAFWPCHKKWQFFWRRRILGKKISNFFDIFLLFKDFFGIFLIRQLAIGTCELRINANQQKRLRVCEFANASSIRTHPYWKEVSFSASRF